MVFWGKGVSFSVNLYTLMLLPTGNGPFSSWQIHQYIGLVKLKSQSQPVYKVGRMQWAHSILSIIVNINSHPNKILIN